MFLSCEHPLFEEPPSDVANLYNTSVTLDGQFHTLNPREALRMAFSLCQLLPRMNQAATYFKDQHCRQGTANYEKSFVFSRKKDA
jgi:hypothetical protein